MPGHRHGVPGIATFRGCAVTAPLTIGLDLTAVFARLDLMEAHIMTTQAEAFDALSAKVDDIAADFTALVAALAVERENLTEAGQAALANAEAKVAALDVAVGDADGSDAVVEEPEAPAPVE